jgi:hypothetical protein
MKTSRILATCAALLGGLSLAQADFQLGSWQSSTAEGWIDHGNQASITDPANAAKYSFAAGSVSGYGQSLKITQAGWNQGLRLNLESIGGGRQAFLDNNLLSFTFSVPSAAEAGGVTAGYSQIANIAINATGYGFKDQGWANATATGDTGNNQSGMPNFYFWSSAGRQSQRVTLDYSSALSDPTFTATAESGWIQLIFASNTGGGAPDYFFINDVVLSSSVVPEPSSLALLAIGAGAVFLGRRRNS